MINDYYLRTTASRWDAMLALGVKLGAIELRYTEAGEPVVVATRGGCWDFIGEIHQTSDGMDVPDTAPVTDAEGNVYLHANLRTPLSLGAVAQEMAAADADIAEALANLGQFFLLDAGGNARPPAQPHRVFA